MTMPSLAHYGPLAPPSVLARGPPEGACGPWPSGSETLVRLRNVSTISLPG